jgi:hypothetical protein
MTQYSRRSWLKRAVPLLGAAALPATGVVALPAMDAAIQTNSTSGQRPKLEITDVRTAQVNVYGPQTHVGIYTDQGYPEGH